jgi:hypothetical protein
MLGHYATTRYILTKAGIGNILATEPRVTEDVYEIRFTYDVKLRFNAQPAGTHRLAMCYESARRLSEYQSSHYCPNITDFGVLPRFKERVMASPAIYHVGALYLAGQIDTSFSDTICENFVGRLGTFITTVAPRSTLYQSPHFVPSKIESASDYDPTWRQILQQIN